MQQSTRSWFRFLYAIGLLLASCALALGQGAEVEPNDTCPTAQDLGALTLPITVEGSLDGSSGNSEIDFFRVALDDAAPELQLDLEGEPTGKGTLSDPFLGVFDSDCNLIASNDDTGSLNSRVFFEVPTDGVVVIAATSCCDGEFIGDGGSSGSYQATMAQAPPIVGSISGRVVNATTGEPLQGDIEPFAFVNLFRCQNGACNEDVSSQSTDSEGRFTFTNDFNGFPLRVGAYQIQVFANLFDTRRSAVFDVGEDDNFRLGDIALNPPPPSIGSISGRVVNARTGDPLRGNDEPFAFVDLVRCLNGSCDEFLNGQSTDNAGRFRFDPDEVGFPHPAGSYEVRVSANRFESAQTEQFNVDAGEDRDLGDIALNPPSLTFGEIRSCGDLPPEGGVCAYSVEVMNNTDEPFSGIAWSIVNASGTGSSLGFATFQTRLRRVQLAPGESRSVDFRFRVPSSIVAGASICTDLFVGKSQSQFDTVGNTFLFCISKR